MAMLDDLPKDLRAIGRETKALEDINSDMGRMLKAYVGLPSAVTPEERTSVREDVVLTDISDLLKKRNSVTVLDACCGYGGLASRASTLSDSDRLTFVAIDCDSVAIAAVKRDSKTLAKRFREFHAKQRMLPDLDGLDLRADLVVLSNVLHELPPSEYAKIFTALNAQLCRKPLGRLAIIDMETLPVESPESIALNWSSREIETILIAAGFAPVVQSYQKKVTVYRAIVERVAQINVKELNRRLRSLLKAKGRNAAARRSAMASPQSVSQYREWLVHTGTMARCCEQLLELGR